MKHRRGFSLIELLIVMGIIGVLCLISISTFRGYWHNSNLRTAAREVMSDMALAKKRAVSESNSFCLQFADGTSAYSINATSCAAPTATQNKDLTNSGPGISVGNTSFTSSRVTFLARGTLGTTAGTVTLTNLRGSTAAISVNVTGRTSVQFIMQ